MSPPWRVAIVGAGIGAEHAAGYAALPDTFTIRWVCDLDAERGADLAAACGAKATTSLEDVLSDPDTDLVDICLPPALHVDTTLQALAAGKHVICEKPLAGSLADVNRIARAAAQTARHLFPVFQYRYGPAMRHLHALDLAGLLGPLRVATLETHWNRGADYYAVPWRGTLAHEMGGALISHAIHIHDLICELGGPVAELSARLATAINDIETEDCAAIWMRLVSGALVTSSVTLGAASDESRLRLVFEHATVESGRSPYTPALEPWTITPRDPSMADAFDAVALDIGSGHDGFAGFFAAVADALNGNGGIGLADGRRSIELATALYASTASGSAVQLPLDPAHRGYDGWARGGSDT
ncbi:MAG: Gfo/Idh/MocA family oxidoreductase [Pseudomonadota bacterium]